MSRPVPTAVEGKHGRVWRLCVAEAATWDDEASAAPPLILDSQAHGPCPCDEGVTAKAMLLT